jgi:hypothetical protein
MRWCRIKKEWEKRPWRVDGHGILLGTMTGIYHFHLSVLREDLHLSEFQEEQDEEEHKEKENNDDDNEEQDKEE